MPYRFNAITNKFDLVGLTETKYEDPVAVATTANLTATYDNGVGGIGATLTNSSTLAAFTADGVTPVVGSRILVKNQTTPAQNGIYVVTVAGNGSTAWVLTRASGYNSPNEITPGDLIPILAGDTQGSSIWVQTETVTSVGVSPINFSIFQASSIDLHTARFIVGNLSQGANYATIAAAYTVAPANSIIYLQQGTYTEDLVLTKEMVFTSGYDARNGDGGNVVWIGKLDDGGNTVNVTLYGILHQNNSDYGVVLTGATDIVYSNCQLRINGNNFFNLNNGNCNLFAYNSDLYIEGSFAFEDLAIGFIHYENCKILNEGHSTVSGTLAGGALALNYCSSTAVYSSSGTTLFFTYSRLDTSFLNITTITLTTASNCNVRNCNIGSGTAQAISLAGGSTLNIYETEINSTNTDAIDETGSADIFYCGLVFTGTATIISVSSMTGAFLPLDNGTAGQVWTSNGLNTQPTFQPLNTTDLHWPLLIVGDVTKGANYATIAAALAVAVSGQTICLQDGTYTENLNLKDGVNICSFGSSGTLNRVNNSASSNATIIGKLSASFVSTIGVTIYGIQLQTNSDYFLSISGANAINLNVVNCYLNCANHTGILLNQTNSKLNISNCDGYLLTTGIAYFNATAGNLSFNNGKYFNSGGSSTVNVFSSPGAVLDFSNCGFDSPITGSSNSFFNAQFSTFIGELILGGTGGNSILGCTLSSGSNPAVSVGAGATLNCYNTNINSSNTNVITGSGTLNYAALTFASGSSTNINVTTQIANVRSTDASKVTIPGAYPYTVLTQDDFVPVDTTSARSVVLPASPSSGEPHTIKDDTGTAGTNNITVSGNGHNIDGSATFVMNTNYQSNTFVYNGTQWNVK